MGNVLVVFESVTCNKSVTEFLNDSGHVTVLHLLHFKTTPPQVNFFDRNVGLYTTQNFP